MLPSLAYYATMLRRNFMDYSNRRLDEIHLSQGLLFFILYVGKHPGCSPKEITKALHMDIGHTTRSLTKLEQSGFLIQQVNPKDRRSHILQLSDAGEDAFRFSHELFAQWDKEVLSVLSREEQEMLLSLLKRLILPEGGASYV